MWDGPVVDAHHHLWQPSRARGHIYPDPSISGPHEWPDFVLASAGVTIEGSVLVQVADVADELLELSDRAAAAPWPTATVPWARLEDAGVGAWLQRVAATGGAKGVRRGTQAEADPAFVARPRFVSGMRMVGELGLVGEVCVLAHQLPAVVTLADACPGTTIVVDHLGKPDPSGAGFSAWQGLIAEVARRPNVWCKASAVVWSADTARLDSEWARTAIRWVARRFGFGRVVFGSNWPVSTLVVSYQRWIRLVSEGVAGASWMEQQALFGDNARRLYGLTRPVSGER